jgi:PKD repeat protein
VYYQWYLGDYTSFFSTVKNPVYTFTKGGKYIIKLKAFSKNGCADSFYKSIFVDSSCVWPGDANFDKKANIKDVLSIGLAYKDTGSVRTDTTTQWYAHPAYDWKKTFKSGANHKHADCNGDGVVDSLDLKAIVRNYGKTHLKSSLSGSGNPSDPALFLSISKDSVTARDTITIEMQLGTKAIPVKDIYGVSFSINYSTSNTNVSKGIKSDFSKCWIGTPGKNLIYLVHNDTVNGVLDIGISRTDQKAVSGYGSLGTLNVITPDNVAGKREVRKEVVFGINDVTSIDNIENDVPLYVINDSVLLYQYKSGIENSNASGNAVSLYPDPATSVLHLISDDPIMEIRIFNAMGEMVYLQTGKHNTLGDLDVTNLKSGIYFIKIQTETGLFTGRFLKQ